NATVVGDVELGDRSVIMFGSVLRAEMDRIVVGPETNIQDNAVIHCDEGFPALIGARVTVGHGAVIHGATIGDHSLVGIGAVVLNGAVVGEGAWVAAGSVVMEGATIAPWSLAVGTPARFLRELTREEIARQDAGVEEYLRLARVYGA
ncbi:MAG: gamma carbonic anhydrase family protein, partial [Acidimicrobiia bacterium]|nr:gamma carbonic anhydrase family protein [Acidimicrobiia bacterium]